jgi:hypothetical protein
MSDSMSRDEAESLAIEALAFVAADQKLLPRFLALTGIEAGDIRHAAAEPGFLAGVLGFILAHEPTLMQYAEASGRSPGAVAAALRHLPTGNQDYDRST